MDRTIPTSPLATQLDDLVREGLVTLNPIPLSDFPSARIVVPVYDSTGTQLVSGGENNAELARYSERNY